MSKSAIGTILRGFLIVAVLIVSPATLKAIPITVKHFSFEDPVISSPPGIAPYGLETDPWVSDNFFQGGIWNITDFPAGYFTVPAPEGKNVLYAGYIGLATGFTQILGDKLQANTVYTLTGYVGHPANLVSTYTVSLLTVDGEVTTTLATTSGNGPSDHFEVFTVQFDSTGSVDVGTPLGILLHSDDWQACFDDIKLDASPASAGLPGDFDTDGDVDETDYTIWNGAFGLNDLGDADGDGDSDAADYTIWRDNFGASLGSGAANANAVPEPASSALFVVALVVLLMQRWN